MRKVIAIGKRVPSMDYEEHLTTLKIHGNDPTVPQGARLSHFQRLGDLRITTYRDTQFRLVGEPVVFSRKEVI